jgi:prepilin-type N-terminal cleavage/methylation domain-containing protein
MKSKSRRGFTLIELLTVIAIIGIMAGMLFPAINAVKRKSKIATSQSTFSQWCTSVNRYKSVYGFYPNIGSSYNSSADSIHKLDDTAVTLKFVKALSGKAPSGSALSTTDRTSLNRNAEEFCAFSKEDYAYYSTAIDTNTLLADKFGNYVIRVIFDTDSTGTIKGITGVTIPDDISSAKSGTGLVESTPPKAVFLPASLSSPLRVMLRAMMALQSLNSPVMTLLTLLRFSE